MDLYKKYAKDIGLVSIANIIVLLKGFILLPILTKSLDVELYGTFALIMVTISLLAPLCTLELGFAVIRFLGAETDKAKISKGVSSIIAVTALISFAMSSLIFVFAQQLALTIFGGIEATFYIQISAFLIFLNAMDQIMLSYFRAVQQIKKYATILILIVFGEITLTAYLVLSGYGLVGVIISFLIIRTTIIVIEFLWIKSQIKFVTPNLSIVKSYLPFSLPILPAALCYWLINLGDRYVIGYFMGASAVGVYSASYSLGAVLALFYAPIPIALFPAITHLYMNNKIQELKMHLKYSLRYFLMFAIPAFFGLSILSKSILTILTTSEFVEGFMIISIIALATILFNCIAINNMVLTLFKETKKSAAIYAISAAINIILNVLFVPMFGIIGAAIATLITFIIHLIMISKISFKLMPYDIDFKFMIKCIIAAGIMAYIIFIFNSYLYANIIFSVFIATIIYFSILIVSGGFTREEFEFLKSILRSMF